MYEQQYSSPPPPSGGIFQAFVAAITKPSVSNYEQLLRNPAVTPVNAYLWVAIASAVGGLVLAIGSSLANSEMMDAVGAILGVVICSGPIAALLSVLVIVISAAVASAIARMFGGTGTYNDTVSLYGVISAPMLLINLVLGAIPYVNFLTTLTGLYQLFMYIQAIRAAHRVDGLKAAIAALAMPVLIFCCVLVFVVLLLSVFATAMADIIPSLPGGIMP